MFLFVFILLLRLPPGSPSPLLCVRRAAEGLQRGVQQRRGIDASWGGMGGMGGKGRKGEGWEGEFLGGPCLNSPSYSFSPPHYSTFQTPTYLHHTPRRGWCRNTTSNHPSQPLVTHFVSIIVKVRLVLSPTGEVDMCVVG